MADQLDPSQTPAETPTALYDTLFPVERYHRALEEARGRVRGIRAGDEKERLIAQKDARYFLTSGCAEWKELCDLCSITCIEAVLAKHREEFGTITLIDLYKFVMEVQGWTVQELRAKICAGEVDYI